jgi:hypothetical protein
LTDLVIPSSVKSLGKGCFSWCKSLSSVTFESLSKLVRIEEFAFFQSGLVCIVIPSSVASFGHECFSNCQRLRSVTFERGSRLRQVGQNVFAGSAISPVLQLSRLSVDRPALRQQQSHQRLEQRTDLPRRPLHHEAALPDDVHRPVLARGRERGRGRVSVGIRRT